MFSAPAGQASRWQGRAGDVAGDDDRGDEVPGRVDGDLDRAAGWAARVVWRRVGLVVADGENGQRERDHGQGGVPVSAHSPAQPLRSQTQPSAATYLYRTQTAVLGGLLLTCLAQHQVLICPKLVCMTGDHIPGRVCVGSHKVEASRCLEIV